MDPTDRDDRVALAVRAVRAVRAVKAATSGTGARPLRVVGWSVLGTSLAAVATGAGTGPEAVEVGPTHPVADTQTEPHEAPGGPADTHTDTHTDANTNTDAGSGPVTEGGHLAPDHVTSTVTAGPDGSVAATTASTWHAPTSGHGTGADTGAAVKDDILVQEFEQAVITQDANGNLVVDTYTHVVVQYHGHTYVSDGHDVVAIDPKSGSDLVLHQRAEVVVHENRDGSYSVHTDAHTTVDLVPDTDGKFDASVTQDETTTLEHGRHQGNTGLDVGQVENVDNHAGPPVTVTQTQGADGRAVQVQNADGRGGGTLAQGQTAGGNATQIQNADGRGSGGVIQGQHGGGHSRSNASHDAASAPAAAPASAPAAATVTASGSAPAGSVAVTSGPATPPAADSGSTLHAVLGASELTATGVAAAIVVPSALPDTHSPAHPPTLTALGGPGLGGPGLGDPGVVGHGTGPGTPFPPDSTPGGHFQTLDTSSPLTAPGSAPTDHFGPTGIHLDEHFQALPAPVTAPPPVTADPGRHPAADPGGGHLVTEAVGHPALPEPPAPVVHEVHEVHEVTVAEHHAEHAPHQTHPDHGASA
ncbi:MAG TPA: hypothetical protein VIY28_19730 [Pseudonocardiaceae bacterium]